MDITSKITGATVALDTIPIIYFIEENRKYFKIVEKIFRCIASGKTSAVISTITLLEVLVLPYRVNNTKLAEAYKNILLLSPGIIVVPLSSFIAEEAARLRAKYAINTPDAIQIATTLHGGAKYFISNDLRLKKVLETSVMILDDYVDL